MMKSTRIHTVFGAFAVAVLLAAPAHASVIVGPDGKPVRGKTWLVIGEKDVARCKGHLDEQTVKLALEPDAKLGTLVARMSAITCKQYLLPREISPDSKLTVIAPGLITPNEAYTLFLTALDSIGVTVERFGEYVRLVETTNAKTVRVALQGAITRFVRFDDDDTEVMARMFRRIKSEHGSVTVLHDALIITDLPDNISRMLRIANNA